MPFPAKSFNGAYSVEGTCHVPLLEDVYSEIFWGFYVSYEWVTTDKYRLEDPAHVEVIQGIERADTLPGLLGQSNITATAQKAGFEVVEERDLA
ncbi:hypothetical protein CDL15_Pgr006987 [Punica granatum]|uniref:SAM-dependent methyltransferase Erg6/SMT-type domain-containing protein n=1 Tax=Punica granatum TaxID=22663 RepID=A0A218X8F0_PUNGR|nr:hypothetical protein CDL15_Pgr006987 [Punica granatum]